MFILLEKNLGLWQTPEFMEATIFETEDDARDFADQNYRVDLAVFEFKGFI
jgi:hypothetical protein